MSTEYDSKWPDIDLFPAAPTPFSSREQLCLKQDQALSCVLDFCPPYFQM